jgi:hypothetical protein
MTPEEYQAREFNTQGWVDDGKPLYAPSSEPGEQGGTAPSFENLISQAQGPHHAAPPQQESPVVLQKQIEAMHFEYNFTLPLQIRRAEALGEAAKIGHLAARTHFWKALACATLVTPFLIFIALLVK